MNTVHYITSDGFSVRFGRYGWVIIEKNPPHDWNRTNEIWREWIKYWQGR